MKLLRPVLLMTGALLWLGCSDAPTDPLDANAEFANLPTSLPADIIAELQILTAADISDLRAAVEALPANVIHSQGNRTAMLARINALEAEIARGNISEAMRHLQNLRRWADGCTSPTGQAQKNDKITDCAAQFAIRDLIDSVIDTLIDKLDPTPTVSINQAAAQADPTSASPIVFTVVFSEPVTGFDAADISLTGTAGGTLVAVVSGSGDPYTVSVTGMTSSGTVVASIPASAALDADNNPTEASTSTDNTVTFNAPPPTVTVNQAASQTDPTSGTSITFTVVFSEPVTGFDAADIAFTGSTATGTLAAAISGTGPTYTVTVTGMTGSGTVVVSIPAGAAIDADSNPTAASTSTDNTVSWVKP